MPENMLTEILDETKYITKEGWSKMKFRGYKKSQKRNKKRPDTVIDENFSFQTARGHKKQTKCGVFSCR